MSENGRVAEELLQRGARTSRSLAILELYFIPVETPVDNSMEK
jgi:hypothetical protein